MNGKRKSSISLSISIERKKTKNSVPEFTDQPSYWSTIYTGIYYVSVMRYTAISRISLLDRFAQWVDEEAQGVLTVITLKLLLLV